MSRCWRQFNVGWMDSVKQEVRFTDKHLGRSAEVIVAASGGHGCR
ncbi:hypothetical protein P3T16_007094, partial [Paraburkholderia sp. GAS42]